MPCNEKTAHQGSTQEVLTREHNTTKIMSKLNDIHRKKQTPTSRTKETWMKKQMHCKISQPIQPKSLQNSLTHSTQLTAKQPNPFNPTHCKTAQPIQPNSLQNSPTIQPNSLQNSPTHSTQLTTKQPNSHASLASSGTLYLI